MNKTKQFRNSFETALKLLCFGASITLSGTVTSHASGLLFDCDAVGTFAVVRSRPTGPLKTGI